jgi:hypothetical protein
MVNPDVDKILLKNDSERSHIDRKPLARLAGPDEF